MCAVKFYHQHTQKKSRNKISIFYYSAVRNTTIRMNNILQRLKKAIILSDKGNNCIELYSSSVLYILIAYVR